MISLAVLVDSAADLSAETDGLDGRLPSFAQDYAALALSAALALKRADPLSDVSIEVRAVNPGDYLSVADNLELAVDAMQDVLVVATFWRMRQEMAAEALAG